MSIRTLLVSAGLVALVCGVAVSQPLPRPSTPPPPPQDRLPPPPPPTTRGPTWIETSPPPAAPAQKSVEELLTELESVRKQKAELERNEKELKAAIAKKLEEQAERLKKLGIALPQAKDVQPDRVGRIIIEGNTKTPDRKILEKLELQPGQILQYPALEKCRAALEKAGFRNVSVEALPNDLDTTFKDIRVRVTEKDAR